MEKKSMPKILICAPSNAAIDEIASRLSSGFRGSEKQSGSIKVVRIGAPATMNNSVLDIALESLVEQKLDPKQAESNEAGLGQIQALKREVDSLRKLISDKHQEKTAVHDNIARTQALAEEIAQLNGRRTQLARQLNHLRDKQKADSRGLDALRRKMRIEVLREADVICSTLSGASSEQLEQIDIEMVVIDEAAQAIELSILIPLKYRFNRCIMVGDPKQLPPTVISTEAS
jgi:senataxin